MGGGGGRLPEDGGSRPPMQQQGGGNGSGSPRMDDKARGMIQQTADFVRGTQNAMGVLEEQIRQNPALGQSMAFLKPGHPHHAFFMQCCGR